MSRMNKKLIIITVPLILVAFAAGLSIEWRQPQLPQVVKQIVNKVTGKRSYPTYAIKVKNYQDIVDRAALNSSFLSRLHFAYWKEAESRPVSQEQPVETVQPPPASDSFSSEWKTYVKLVQKQNYQNLALDQFSQDEPLDVQLHHIIEQESEGGRYAIEVLTWQALPGLYMPATIYRPAGKSDRRYPVILTPPGCKEDVATHNEATSVQRRMANFALAGFVAFTTLGYCQNGVIGENSDNRYMYESYTRAAGSAVTGGTLKAVTWLRALDLLGARRDTDMSRVGVTGYSNGAATTMLLGRVTDRVHALALVTAGVGKPSYLGSFNASRQRSVFEHVPYFYYGADWPSPFFTDAQLVQRIADLQTRLSRDLSGNAPANPVPLMTVAGYGMGLPLLFVLGEQDGIVTASDYEAHVSAIASVWRRLGVRPPRLDIVPGRHVYDAERRARVTKWFSEVLRSEPLLPFPNRGEHETPVLSEDRLMAQRNWSQGASLHALFAGKATEIIESRRSQFRLADLPVMAARQHVEMRLGLDRLPKSGFPRPILIDEAIVSLDGTKLRFQYWVIGITEHIRTGLWLLYPVGTEDPDLVLHLFTGNESPTEEETLAQLSNGGGIGVVIPPGFGPTASSQVTRGNLAGFLGIGPRPTLLGLGVGAVRAALSLIDRGVKAASVTLHAHGVEAGVIAAFSAALDVRVAGVRVEQGLRSFRDILTAPSKPVVPPVLLISGILSDVDMDDLRRLAEPRRIEMISESDLSEFSPIY